MIMHEGALIVINNVPVRYEGAGWDRHWFTLIVINQETTFCVLNCSARTISRGVRAALKRYSKYRVIA
jgi:hypothetical protein